MSVKILLVEDDEKALDMFREALTEYDYEVVTARNGEEALQRAREDSFDLVVTDIRMPGRDGLDALEEVKALNPDTRSIVVTGYASEAETLKAMQIGVGEYLKKPFRLSELLRAVRRQLEISRQDEQQRQRERAHRQTLMWALKLFLSEGRVPRSGWVQETGKWAITLSRQLGLPDDEVESLSLAALLLALQKAAPDALPSFVKLALPESVRALLRVGGDLEVAAESLQVMDAAQRLAQSSQAPELKSAEGGDDFASRRGLLQVALSLEAAHDFENALVALTELAQSGVNREAALASLAAARIQRKAGRPGVAEQAHQAWSLARSIGPMAQAEVSVEAGILLALAQHDEARSVLAEGRRVCESLGMSARVSLARLAENIFFDSATAAASLRQVVLELTPREFREHAYWLLPSLLQNEELRPLPEVAPLFTALFAAEPALAQRLSRDPRHIPAVRALSQQHNDPELHRALGYQPQEASAPTAEPTGKHALRLFGLGRMEFFVDGRPLAESAWKRNQKAKLMLFRLCLEPERSFTDDVLIEELWPGQDHAGKANLNALRATLRSALRQEGGDGFEFVLREGKGTRIHPECTIVLDVHELTEATQQARQARGQAFEKLHLARVVELYTGPFLEACYLEWALSTRNQMEQMVLEALFRLAQLADQAESHDQVLECSTRILQLDGCNQEAFRIGMQAHLNSGRPEQAVRLFERGSRALKAELGMEPTIELLSLYHRARLSI